MNAPEFLARSENPVGLTAAQIAAAARLSKRAVLKALAETPAAGSVIVRGNETSFWTFDVLTDGIQEAIIVHARTGGLTAAEYLESFARPWQPEQPFSRIDENCIEAARKLRSALLPTLQRRDAIQFGPAERVQMGLQDYKRAFGHAISERHWQRLLARTLRRDGGAENFQRLEIFLPDKLKTKAESRRLLPDENQFGPLLTIIRACSDASAPTNAERAAIWHEAFEIYESPNQAREKAVAPGAGEIPFPARAGAGRQ